MCPYGNYTVFDPAAVPTTEARITMYIEIMLAKCNL
jgi:hypothetical protein